MNYDPSFMDASYHGYQLGHFLLSLSQTNEFLLMDLKKFKMHLLLKMHEFTLKIMDILGVQF